MIWIPITVAAAAFQVARNAAQRSVMGGAGPWGATLVRFLFGLPFATLFAAVAWAVTPGASVHATSWFWLACGAGAALQIAATAALLVAMQRSSFALGTALQQSGLLFALVWGVLLFGDTVSTLTWTGGLVATAGLAVLTWPRGETPMRRGGLGPVVHRHGPQSSRAGEGGRGGRNAHGGHRRTSSVRGTPDPGAGDLRPDRGGRRGPGGPGLEIATFFG